MQNSEDAVRALREALRAIALVRLGRRDEAGATIEAALARDPENAVTHANQGWAPFLYNPAP